VTAFSSVSFVLVVVLSKKSTQLDLSWVKVASKTDQSQFLFLLGQTMQTKDFGANY